MVYILLAPGFEEAEALVPADLLRRAGVPVTLAGAGGEIIPGGHGIAVQTDAPLESVILSAGDALVLPGGTRGVENLEASPAVLALARQAAASPEILLAAICAAPAMLARRGVLRPGVRAVCYPGLEGDLSAAGAVPEMGSSAVAEDSLITGRAAGSAFDFGLALVERLAGPEQAEKIRAGIHYGG